MMGSLIKEREIPFLFQYMKLQWGPWWRSKISANSECEFPLDFGFGGSRTVRNELTLFLDHWFGIFWNSNGGELIYTFSLLLQSNTNFVPAIYSLIWIIPFSLRHLTCKFCLQKKRQALMSWGHICGHDSTCQSQANFLFHSWCWRNLLFPSTFLNKHTLVFFQPRQPLCLDRALCLIADATCHPSWATDRILLVTVVGPGMVLM